ncbi:MAG: metallophosphoesterase family protein [Planctomycetota bacterium]
MSERKLVGLLLSLCVTVSVCSAGKIPSRIGKWRVEVGPPGNDFYQAPQKKKDKPKPPSETVLRHTRIFVPHMKVTDWEYDDGEYEIRCGRGDEEYKFNVTPEGELTELQYENDETDVEEEADELVLRGTKKDIAVNEVPKAALATLAEAYPNAEPSKAWTSETIAGRRYVIQIAEMAFYARPDGQIQAGRPIDDGGLDEIYPPSRAKNEKTFKADLEKLLGPYRERFNFDNQIKRLGKDPRSADGSYRFVVMGDSRSQWALWSSMVKHIDSLDPKPAFVVNSGDAVPKGHAGEFNEYYVPPLLKTDVPFFIATNSAICSAKTRLIIISTTVKPDSYFSIMLRTRAPPNRPSSGSIRRWHKRRKVILNSSPPTSPPRTLRSGPITPGTMKSQRPLRI